MLLAFPQIIENILAASLILLLPGAAWLVWSPQNKGFLPRLADAVGISISATALTALAGFYLKIPFTRPLLTGIYGFCALIFLAGLIRLGMAALKRPFPWRDLGMALLGAAALTALFVWRFSQARELVLPAWVDSVHHSLLVRIFVENSGIPDTLAPYLPVTFSYHYGFHVLGALFAGLTGSDPAAAVLWLGQVLNALVALSVFRLALEIWQDWRRAALAGLLVGFSLHMPAYYLTWGRYTLLTGLIVLPLAMASLLRLARQPENRAAFLLSILLTAGTALSHYTALLLLGFFTAILMIWKFFQTVEKNPARYFRLNGVWQTGLAALLGVLAASPWLVRVWQQLHSEASIAVVSPLDAGQGSYWSYILYLLGPEHNAVWLALAGVGLIWAVFRRPARPLAFWGLLLALLTLPWGLRLGPFRPDHMAIVLFIPGALFAADLVFNLVELAGRLPRPWLQFFARTVLILAAVAGVAWGAWKTRDILNPQTVFVNQADLDALVWVRSNTPPTARFLINTTRWMGSTYRGVDGGYWLLSYTGRPAVLPPVLYTYSDRRTVDQIERWAEQASALTTCDAAFWQLVREFKANFVYVKLGQGRLQPAGLAHCSQLVNVYRRGGVYIYEIVP
jgi:hypothetical protein